MHILLIVPDNLWTRMNLEGGFRACGCPVTTFYYSRFMALLASREWRAARDRKNQELVALAERLKKELTLIFCVVYDDFLLTDTAKRLRALGVPLVNYHVDMVSQWYRVIRTARYFDAIAVAQWENIQYLSRYANRIIRLPMAANPDYFAARCLDSETGEREELSFVGSATMFRVKVLAELCRRGLPVSIFGMGWDRSQREPFPVPWDAWKIIHDLRYYAVPRARAHGVRSVFVDPVIRKLIAPWPTDSRPPASAYKGVAPADGLPTLFRRSACNLGINEALYNPFRSRHQLQMRARDFEVPMAGGFYLVQRVPELEEFFTPGEEIETWCDVSELEEKARYYLDHPAKRRAIAERGQARALRDHTWKHRLDSLKSALGLS